MKNFIIAIICIFIGFSIGVVAFAGDTVSCDCKNCPDISPYLEPHKEFTGSYSEMYDYQQKTIESLYKRYDILCKRIINNFKGDKEFIEHFQKNNDNFKLYRDEQGYTVFPKDPINYGFMYHDLKWGIDYTLTVFQIERIRENVYMYCEMNSEKLKDSSVCSENRLNKLFEGMKLK